VTRAVEVRVTGRVQGVSFRWYAAREGVRLGLTGWVRNEPDGSVTAHLEGADDAVEEMLAWCRKGSPAATVDRVEVTEVTPTGGRSFEIGWGVS
jgi:acylphosphatase